MRYFGKGKPECDTLAKGSWAARCPDEGSHKGDTSTASSDGSRCEAVGYIAKVVRKAPVDTTLDRSAWHREETISRLEGMSFVQKEMVRVSGILTSLLDVRSDINRCHQTNLGLWLANSYICSGADEE